MYRGGMRSIFSELVRSGRLMVIDQLKLPEVKTKSLAQALQNLGVRNVLICLEQEDENIKRAARNLAHVDAIASGKVDPLSLLRHDRVLCSESAIRILEERFRERTKAI